MGAVARLADQVILQGADQHLDFGHATRASATAPIVPVDLAGCSFRLQIRPSLYSDQLLDELTSANGRIEILDAAEGRYRLKFPAATSSAMTWKKGIGDLEITYSTGAIDRLWRAAFALDPEVTR